MENLWFPWYPKTRQCCIFENDDELQCSFCSSLISRVAFREDITTTSLAVLSSKILTSNSFLSQLCDRPIKRQMTSWQVKSCRTCFTKSEYDTAFLQWTQASSSEEEEERPRDNKKKKGKAIMIIHSPFAFKIKTFPLLQFFF